MAHVMTTDREQSDRYRHQCEVRYLLAASREEARGQKYVHDYLNHPKVQGRRAALERDVKLQGDLGNDGRHGQWL
ncbi:hypothetical protein ACFIQF_11520 [Comamonas sp. J-3]|uniref:hypothetical protein n=1 Tax=Comamonas trifloxystrobinivorans TaxID=3350256 RepID=UPI003727308C